MIQIHNSDSSTIFCHNFNSLVDEYPDDGQVLQDEVVNHALGESEHESGGGGREGGVGHQKRGVFLTDRGCGVEAVGVAAVTATTCESIAINLEREREEVNPVCKV